MELLLNIEIFKSSKNYDDNLPISAFSQVIFKFLSPLCIFMCLFRNPTILQSDIEVLKQMVSLKSPSNEHQITEVNPLLTRVFESTCYFELFS